MIQLSRNIVYDSRLGKYTVDVVFDGENETLLFDTKTEAFKEYRKLRKQSETEIIALALDKSI